jgi:hypothetical protein
LLQVPHPVFDDSTEFFIACSNFKVEEEGATPFEDEAPAAAPAAAPQVVVDTNLAARASHEDHPNILGDISDVENLRAQGITVDNEDVLPENDVAPAAAAAAMVGEWKKPTICPRKANNLVGDVEASWRLYRWSQIKDMSEFDLFRMSFPEAYIIEVMLPETNKHIDGEDVTLSEFYKWLGCFFFMACFEGVSDRREWWSSEPINKFKGAPFRLNEYMSRQRHDKITQAMRYTNVEPPTNFVNKFHDVRQLLAAFNEHYEENYIPSYINCLDESMCTWFNKYAPGFMVVTRKPHPFGNEYHSICDGDNGAPIMWRVKLQEGKDRPKKSDGSWAFPEEFEDNTPTVKLMLWMTKPIHNTGKQVCMDSGFCVGAGILAMHKVGVYGAALIKKRRYWPRLVPGDQIDAYFKDKGLGVADTLEQDIEGTKFLIHCQNDTKYVTKIMATYGLICENADHTTYRHVGGEWKSFKYVEPMSRHNHSKHWVDDFNQRRHQPIALEDVWKTTWWPHRQFTFLLSVAEVNSINSRARARRQSAEQQLDFRCQLAKGMLENTIDDYGNLCCSPVRPRKRSRMSYVEQHSLETKPNFMGLWDNSTKYWTKVKTKYLKSKCSSCSREIRTYCSCNKSVPMCQECWGKHKQQHSNTLF